MTIIKVKENEPFEVAMRRFKRTIEKTGLLKYIGGNTECTPDIPTMYH